MVREPRELGIELELHARGQEREALEQSFDIRVRDVETTEAETARDLRILGGELGAYLAHELELALVVLQQARVHQDVASRPGSVTATLPVSRSISVRRNISSGNGCAHSCAVISNVTVRWFMVSAATALTRTELRSRRGSKFQIASRSRRSTRGMLMPE